MIIDLKSVGFVHAEDVQSFRRVKIQAKPANGNPDTAVIEVKRAFDSRADSPRASFSTTKTITLDGSSILEIDVTDTAWLHLEITTAQADRSVEIEIIKSAPMRGISFSSVVDVAAVGVRDSIKANQASKAFVLARPIASNTSAIEIKHSVDESFEPVSFASAANLTIDGSTITEISTNPMGWLHADCGTLQADQRVELFWYLRNETLDDVESSGEGSTPELARFSLSAAAGTYTTTYTTVPLDRVDNSQSWASNSSGTITLDAGTYLVMADVTTDELSGSNRTEFESVAMENSTGSYVAVPGTIRRHYSRTSSQAAQSASMSFLVVFGSSKSIQIQSRRFSGSSTGWWVTDGVSVTIQKIA
jgi:hypothetical protein